MVKLRLIIKKITYTSFYVSKQICLLISRMVQNFTRSNLPHAAIACAGIFAVAAYVLFGDTPQSATTPAKKKRKKGGLPGLVNIGNSCFINCILQALASSVAYNNWLATQDSKYTRKLFLSLRDVLQKLNDESDEDTTAVGVLSALNDQKLFVSAGEQDAHELFIALISAVNDELVNAEQESASLLDIGWALCTPSDADAREEKPEPADAVEAPTMVSLEGDISLNSTLRITDCSTSSPKLGRIVTRLSNSLNHDTERGKRLIQSDCPFSGSLASQLQCIFCGGKNPDQWTTFHTISLCFPTQHIGSNQFKLEGLLETYIKKEIIELNCDKCSKTRNTPFSKQLTFGKLPDCLCIHIQRNVWTVNGLTVKLTDHVIVPEYIDMEPFTYSNNLRKQPNNVELEVPCQPVSINEALRALSSMQSELVAGTSNLKGNNIYKLQAVVVHVGDAYSGHFVTYRRGSINSTFRNRWFYTSDSIVTEVSFDQVLNSNAYMILYEKLT